MKRIAILGCTLFLSGCAAGFTVDLVQATANTVARTRRCEQLSHFAHKPDEKWYPFFNNSPEPRGLWTSNNRPFLFIMFGSWNFNLG